jgi:hypothetical protein
MGFAGIRGTGNWGADERPTNFREGILFRQPNGTAPLTALLAKMKSETVDDPQFSWWEEELRAVRVRVNNAGGYGAVAAGTQQTWTISALDGLDGTDLVPGDLLQVEIDFTSTYAIEVLKVISVASATSVTVQRGYGNPASASGAVPDQTFLTKIGNVFAEGSGSPNISQRNPTKMYNFCQIFKTAYGTTRTNKGVKARTGNALVNDRKRKMFDHSTAMELAFLFGKRSEIMVNGKAERTTGGVMEMLSLYSPASFKRYTVPTTEDSFLNDVYPIWDYQSSAGNERIAFCGNLALNSLNRLARSSPSTRITFQGTLKLYGMELESWRFPQGTIAIKTHPLFNLHSRYSSDMLIIDPTVLSYRKFMDTKHQDGIQANDEDAEKGQWISEVGLELHHGKTCKWLSNINV